MRPASTLAPRSPISTSASPVHRSAQASWSAPTCRRLCVAVDRWRVRPSRGPVLHDQFRDIRTPTHELTIARDVLRTRRRMSGQSPDWALSAEGIRTLRQTAEITPVGPDEAEAVGTIRRVVATEQEGEGRMTTTSEISSVSITPPSMRCSPDWRLLSKVPNDLAVAAFKIKIDDLRSRSGTRMPGSTNGAACCGRRNTCRAVLVPFAALMPGTSFPSCKCALAWSAACCINPTGSRHHHRRASRRHQSWPENHSSIGAGIATGKPGCLPSPTAGGRRFCRKSMHAWRWLVR